MEVPTTVADAVPAEKKVYELGDKSIQFFKEASRQRRNGNNEDYNIAREAWLMDQSGTSRNPENINPHLIEYYNGDPSSPYYDSSGIHGNPNPNNPNYRKAHAHDGWDTPEHAEEYAQRLAASGLQVGSRNDGIHADGSLHDSNQAVDSPIPYGWTGGDALYYKLTEMVAAQVGSGDALVNEEVKRLVMIHTPGSVYTGNP